MEINRVFYEDLQDILYDSNIDFQKLKNCSVLVTGVTVYYETRTNVI